MLGLAQTALGNQAPNQLPVPFGAIHKPQAFNRPKGVIIDDLVKSGQMALKIPPPARLPRAVGAPGVHLLGREVGLASKVPLSP